MSGPKTARTCKDSSFYQILVSLLRLFSSKYDCNGKSCVLLFSGEGSRLPERRLGNCLFSCAVKLYIRTENGVDISQCSVCLDSKLYKDRP